MADFEANDNPYGPKKTKEKVEEIGNLTKECRRIFALPATEKVIQVYKCGKKLASGRLYITQNYIGFYSKVPKVVEKYQFRKIKELTKVKLASIRIRTDDGTIYDYGGFTQREEAYQILHHLMEHAPSYTLVDTECDVAARSPKITENDGTMTEVPEEAQVLRNISELVDTGASKRALAKAYEARDMGQATMEELSRQAEVIDRMDQRMQNIDANLDHTERHLRGIESVAGGLANKFTKDKTKRKQLVFKKRDLEIQKIKKKNTEVPCLYKYKNDKLQEAVILFKEREFTFLDAKTKKVIEDNCTHPYSEVDLCLIRARHQHLDVWFKSGGKEKRLRFMTAHMQPVVNSFSLRVGDSLKVTWEPGAKKFDYGSVELAGVPTRGRRDGGGGANLFGTTSSSKLISKGAPRELHDAMAQQDRDLDEIGNVVDDLYGMAGAMGDEVDRSNRQLSHLNHQAEKLDERIARQNHRVERQIAK